MPLTLLVAAVALPRLDLRLRALLHVLRERAPHVVRLLELPLLVAPHVTLVRARVDQLAVTLLLCHAQVTPLFFTPFPDGENFSGALRPPLLRALLEQPARALEDA